MENVVEKSIFRLKEWVEKQNKNCMLGSYGIKSYEDVLFVFIYLFFYGTVDIC